MDIKQIKTLARSGRGLPHQCGIAGAVAGFEERGLAVDCAGAQAFLLSTPRTTTQGPDPTLPDACHRLFPPAAHPTDQTVSHGRPSTTPSAHCQPFQRIYTARDLVELLADMDTLHETPSGPMIKKLCECTHGVFGDPGYERLTRISVSHLYNLLASDG